MDTEDKNLVEKNQENEKQENEHEGEEHEGEEHEGEEVEEEVEEEEEKVKGKVKTSIDFMTDQQLIDVCLETEISISHMQLENHIFLDFLKKISPASIEGLEEQIQYAIGLALNRPVSAAQIYSPSEISIRGEGEEGEEEEPKYDKVFDEEMFSPSLTISQISSSTSESIPSVNNLLEGRGPKINLNTKADLIQKAFEEVQANHNAFLKKSHKIKRNLKSDLEEYGIREIDLTNAKNLFEYNVVQLGVDVLTGKIPAEKWIRYMVDWLKNAELGMEKLRLRSSSLRHQYRKLSVIFRQRQELGANVTAVDFDQLEIANKHLIHKIEQKQVHLVELKKMNGGANLVLSKHKKFLLHQQMDYNRLQQAIEAKKLQINELEEELNRVIKERDTVKEGFAKFKEFKNSYRVPDVMEYVMLKKELDELKKNIKVWQRRKSIQEISLNASIREIKTLTGSSTIDPAWLEDPPQEEDDDYLFSL